MTRCYGRRVGLLALALLASGCHMRRPGEVRPQPIAPCSPMRIAEIEGRFAQAGEAERELLEYCRTAQAAEALSATQEHVDYMADLQFLGILLSAVSVILVIVVES